MPNRDELLDRGLQLHQAGNWSDAEKHYRAVTQVAPEHPRALFLLALLLHHAGRNSESVSVAQFAIERTPSDAGLYNNLGEALRALGRNPEAATAYRKAIALEPATAQPYLNLGVLLSQMGQAEQAIDLLLQAIQKAPAFAKAYFALGTVQAGLGRLDEALLSFSQASARDQRFSEPHCSVGDILRARNDVASAVEAYHRALTIHPGNVAALNNLGLLLTAHGRSEEAIPFLSRAVAARETPMAHITLAEALFKCGQVEEAERHCLRAVEIEPQTAQVNGRLGEIALRRELWIEAIAYFRKALSQSPQEPNWMEGLGIACHQLTILDEAEAAYKGALAIQPMQEAALAGLATIAFEKGDLINAGHILDAGHVRFGHVAWRLNKSLILPVIPDSVQDILQSRQRYEAALDQMLESDVKLEDPEHALGRCHYFYLSYHGLDNKGMNTKLGHFMRQACPKLSYVAPHCKAPSRRAGARSRLGVYSRFFGNHTIGRLARGILGGLPKDQIELFAISEAPFKDEIALDISNVAAHTVRIPSGLLEARDAIARLELDALIYLDIGMHPLSYWLAFSRLAPIQCVAPGHPDTTGISTIDRYLSFADYEPPDAQRHYSEQLIALPEGVGTTAYVKPRMPERWKSRAQLGLPEAETIYCCPQALFKFHPDFDVALGGILEADPSARLLFIDGLHSHWRTLLLQRLKHTLGANLSRVSFLPRLSHVDYLNVLYLSDVVLDTFHFGGGNSSYEAFAVGAPVVTLPGEFARARCTAAMYRHMGISACTAKTVDQFVSIAVELGLHRDLREGMREEIAKRSPILFENSARFAELGEGFLELIRP